MNYLPIKLNKLRKHYNYSQQYVADKLGVDVVEYMNYENGNSMINYSQMKKLASFYHISMKEMFMNSENVELHEIDSNTDEINAQFFMPENNLKNKIKSFILNHRIATIIIFILLVAIIVLSVILSNAYKPYQIYRENINRLSVSDSTVIYIDDSGNIGVTGSNSNGQMNNLTVTNAIKVCEGNSFSIVLNEDGTVVSSGLISKYEKQVASWKNIVDIAAKNNHIVAVDSNGKVYCAGESEACEIEGTRNVKKVYATDNAAICLTEVGTLVYKGSFFGSSYLNNFLNIADIASSENILAILNNDKTLNIYSKSSEKYLKAETWSNIVDVTCGNDFVAALDEFGKVYIEIENDEAIEEVNEWSNIIAIDAGKDYLIAFDGKNIYGIGKNNYNQFTKEEKQKTTLEQVKNIEYIIDKDKINILFDEVRNSSGYLVELNVGTGMSKKVNDAQTVSFLTENMIEGKTYTLSIVSLGSGEYKDSDPAEISFVFNRPEEIVNIDINKYIGHNKQELEEYLTGLDITFKGDVDESNKCENDEEIVVSIEGLTDGNYKESDINTTIVKYKYCKVVYDD